MKKVIITGNSFEIKGGNETIFINVKNHNNEDKIFTPIMSNFETNTQLMYDKEKDILSVILNKSMCMNLNIKSLTLKEIYTKLRKASVYAIHEINVTGDSEIRLMETEENLCFIDDDKNCEIVVKIEQDYKENINYEFSIADTYIKIENSFGFIKIRKNLSDLKSTLEFLQIPFMINLNIEGDQ